MRLFERLKTNTSNREKKRSSQAVVYCTGSRLPSGRRIAYDLPGGILEQIFSFVCPHTKDLSYKSWDDSVANDSECQLCQTGDLARCSRVCKSWCIVAQRLLYQSVRIEVSHFCDQEDQFDTGRTRRSQFPRSTSKPKDPLQWRFERFVHTQRQNHMLAGLTRCLKVPWGIREVSRADLARAVSVLPNLQYVDLPAGEFENVSADEILNQELRHKCPDLRMMRYNKGAERSLNLELVPAAPWPRLEILTLNSLDVEPEGLLAFLASFSRLRELTLINIDGMEDAILQPQRGSTSFPSLCSLTIKGKTSLTVEGLLAYLSVQSTQDSLSSLSLIETDLPVHELHKILSAATRLKRFEYLNDVDRAIGIGPLTLLKSQTLETLHFEILPSASNDSHIIEGYYRYLARSISSASLPALTSVFACSSHFPSVLLQTAAISARDNIETTQSTGSLNASSTSQIPDKTNIPTESSGGHLLLPPQTLTIYTKPASIPEQEWSVTTFDPPNVSKGDRGRMSETIPISMLLAGPQSQGLPFTSSIPISQLAGGLPARGSSAGGRTVGSSHGGKKGEEGQWTRSFRPAVAGSAWMGADY